MKIVEIHWLDATCDSGWIRLEKAKKGTVVDCRTIGYLFHETRKAYYVTSTVDNDLGVLGYNIIPKSMLVSKREIKLEEEK